MLTTSEAGHWELVEESVGASVEADTIFGRVEVEWIKSIDTDGNGEFELELSTTFFNGDKVMEEGDTAKVKIKREKGIPVNAVARIHAFMEGCGDIDIEMHWGGGEYSIERQVEFDSDGTPLRREWNLSVEEAEFDEVKICGLDLLDGVTA